ncbi:MAG: site-2 protease family protein [Akkermansia sp.]|nr:site-2 protease family protein [Akkermansia sp.]
MIRFTLFGVQVSIHPTLWITLALLGGGCAVSQVADVLAVCLFIIAGFVCLLAHEMGHALTSRAMGGGHPEVHLAWLGGDCVNETARLTRMQGVLMTAAGPLASLLVGVVAAAVLGLYVGSMGLGFFLARHFVFGVVPTELLEGYPAMAILFFLFLIEVSFWWTILNLLPVFPLDGGQIMHGLMRSPRQMHTISLVAAVTLLLMFISLGMWLVAVLMGALAYLNYRMRENTPY